MHVLRTSTYFQLSFNPLIVCTCPVNKYLRQIHANTTVLVLGLANDGN